jgi:hypothetical protein
MRRGPLPRIQQKRLPPAPIGSCGSWVARQPSSQVALPINGILPKRACDVQEKVSAAGRAITRGGLAWQPVASSFDSNGRDKPIVETLWTLLLTFCAFLKLPTQFSGEQDVQSISATVHQSAATPPGACSLVSIRIYNYKTYE